MASYQPTTICFNTYGNDKQQQVAEYWIDNEVTDIAYGGSKGSGKSYLGVSLIFGDALIYSGTNYFIARKELNDLRKYTTATIKEVFDHWGLDDRYYKFNGVDNFYTLYNGSKVFLLEAAYKPTDPLYARFGSIQMTRGMIEEAGEVDGAAKRALQATVGRWKNDVYSLRAKLLITLNPAKNFVYEEYYLPHKENRLPPFRKFVQALPTDNKKLPKNYVTDLLKILTFAEAQRLVYGIWEYDDNPFAMYDYDTICNLFTNSYVKAQGQKYISADVAYLGSDLFVIYIWQGFRIIKVIAIDKIDETQIGVKLRAVAEEYGVPHSNIVYDADGLRKFTANSLAKMEAAKPFINNSKPLKDDQYKNLKAECAFLLKEKLEAGEIFCEDLTYKKQIISDLEQICREPADKDLKIALESKKSLKLRINRSPDFFDGLMMRMYFELKPKIVWD